MLYDGQCPLCSREVALLKRKNNLGRIAFEDITEPAFDPSQYGLTMPELVASMHAVRPDGSVLKGVDVFAELYDAVGWTWLSRPLRWRLTRPLAQAGYRVFAAVRPKFSRFRPAMCETDRCLRQPEQAKSI